MKILLYNFESISVFSVRERGTSSTSMNHLLECFTCGEKVLSRFLVYFSRHIMNGDAFDHVTSLYEI